MTARPTPMVLVALATGLLSATAMARGPEPPDAAPLPEEPPASAAEQAGPTTPPPDGAPGTPPSAPVPDAEAEGISPAATEAGAAVAPVEPAAGSTAPAAGSPTAPPAPATAGYRFPTPPPAHAVGGVPPSLEPGPDGEDDGEPLPLLLGHWLGAELGLRTTLIADDGFEPYGGGDLNMLGQLVLAATFAPLELGPVSLGIVPEYSVGVRGEQTREQEASVAVHRLAGGVLADVALIRHLHLYARVALGATYLHGRITSNTVDQQLEADNWTWGLDTTGGLAVLLGTVGERGRPDAGFWLRAELGYAFAGEAEMSYSVDSDDEARRFGSVGLPAVTPGGVISRWTLGVSFL